ncbi:hypothetical protein HY477_00805 [Candidatus Uhrbacteria bacterium]|nr:hypothetical protein [Candidatus Uhrbacteria bacterium]
MTRITITGLLTLFAALLASAPAQAAFPVACKDGTTVYLPQAGDPICKQFTCVAVGKRDRYQDVAKRHGLTVGQIWQFEVPEGMGTNEHPTGTAPNIAGGWTVVGEFPTWRHIRNADTCIDTVPEMVAAARFGRNLQGALRHDIPNLVVVIPSEPNPCLDNLAQCGAAYHATKAQIAATSGELNCWHAGKEWKNGQCVARAASGTLATDVRVDLARVAVAQTCESNGGFYRWSDGGCLTKAQMATIVGADKTSADWGSWLAAAALVAITILVLVSLLIGSRFAPAAEQFREDVRREPEADAMRTQRDQLRGILDTLVSKVQGFVRFTVSVDVLATAVDSLLRELSELRAKVTQVEGERDAAQQDAAAKQLSSEAADARNAELSERVGKAESDLEGARRSMQEAGAALDTERAVTAELQALREEVAEVAASSEAVVDSAMALAATPPIKATRDDAQDAEIRELQRKLNAVGASLTRDVADIHAFVVEHPRSKSLREVAIEAVERLRQATTDLATPAN